MAKKVFITLFSIIGALFTLLICIRGAFGNTSKITIDGFLSIFNGFDLRIPFSTLIECFDTINNGFDWNSNIDFANNVLDAVKYGFNYLLVPIYFVLGLLRFMAYIATFMINCFIYILGYNPLTL